MWKIKKHSGGITNVWATIQQETCKIKINNANIWWAVRMIPKLTDRQQQNKIRNKWTRKQMLRLSGFQLSLFLNKVVKQSAANQLIIMKINTTTWAANQNCYHYYVCTKSYPEAPKLTSKNEL